jgi:hypothetical protein
MPRIPPRDDPEAAGRRAHEGGADWRDNPYRHGSADWFAFEDGRRDAGAKDVGTAPGTPAWG